MLGTRLGILVYIISFQPHKPEKEGLFFTFYRIRILRLREVVKFGQGQIVSRKCGI